MMEKGKRKIIFINFSAFNDINERIRNFLKSFIVLCAAPSSMRIYYFTEYFIKVDHIF